MSENTSSTSDTSTPSRDEIIGHFNDLRNQQKNIAEKITELNLETKEHEVVLQALSECDPKRKCFRQIGTVLVERTVDEVMPALKINSNNIAELVKKLTSDLENTGAILNEYRDKYGVRLQGEQQTEKKPTGSGDAKETPAAGVLVA